MEINLHIKFPAEVLNLFQVMTRALEQQGSGLVSESTSSKPSSDKKHTKPPESKATETEEKKATKPVEKTDTKPDSKQDDKPLSNEDKLTKIRTLVVKLAKSHKEELSALMADLGISKFGETKEDQLDFVIEKLESYAK